MRYVGGGYTTGGYMSGGGYSSGGYRTAGYASGSGITSSGYQGSSTIPNAAPVTSSGYQNAASLSSASAITSSGYINRANLDSSAISRDSATPSDRSAQGPRINSAPVNAADVKSRENPINSVKLSDLPRTGLTSPEADKNPKNSKDANQFPSNIKLSPGWQDRLPSASYGTPGNPAPKNPLGPNGTADIKQNYGDPWSRDASKLHTGADLFSARGALVAATNAGFVSKVGWLGCKDRTFNCDPKSKLSDGNYVVVTDKNGQAQGYLHVNSSLKKGDAVRAGQVIGTVYENHLHYNQCLHAEGCQRGAVASRQLLEQTFLQPDVNDPARTSLPARTFNSWQAAPSTPDSETTPMTPSAR